MRNLFFLSFLILLTGCVKSNPDLTAPLTTPLTPLVTIPNAPTNLKGVVHSSTQITLSWRDESTNESEFKIERKIGSGAFVVVGSTSKDIISFNDINLIPNTIYTYRVFSKNSYGNSNNNSNEINGSTPNSELMVTIGSQIWSKFNLDVTTYNDGTLIPQVSNPVEWSKLTTGAWCYYKNDTANGVVYGKLYNWYAVAGIHDNDPTTPNKTLAPSGWKMPSSNDWKELTDFLGAREVAGSKMKATGTALWNATNIATNISGFTALPGGDRRIDGSFESIGNWTTWWSSTEYDGSDLARGLGIQNYSPFSFIAISNKKQGLSVRCVFEGISLNNL